MRVISRSKLLLLLFLTSPLSANLPAQTTPTGSLTIKVTLRYRSKSNKAAKQAPKAIEREPKSDKELILRFVHPLQKKTPKLRPDGTFYLEEVPQGDWDYDVIVPSNQWVVEKDPTYVTVDSGDNKKRQSITITLSVEALASKTRKLPIELVFYRHASFKETTPTDTPKTLPSQIASPNKLPELKGIVLEDPQTPLLAASVSLVVVDNDTSKIDLLDQTKTDERGNYILHLPPNKKAENYILIVKKEGYDPLALVLAWGEAPPSVLTMKKVGVAADTPKQTSTNSEEREPLSMPSLDGMRRYVFSPRLMQSLPVSGYRSFDEFALLAPGVFPPPQTFGTSGPSVSPGVGTAGQFAINGIRSRENNFSVDGADNNDEDIGTRRQGFVSLTLQPIETLQEFQVITALADARYGRNAGGQINALTQTGSLDLHASVYGFFTSNRFNARDFFDHTSRSASNSFAITGDEDNAPILVDGRPLIQPNPSDVENPLKRTQAGLLASGRFAPTGTILFGSIERKVNRESRESHFAVPTVEQRGVFGSGATGLRAAGAPIFPATIAGNAIFSLYPFPNNPSGPYGGNTHSSVLPANADATLFTIKASQRFGTLDLTKKHSWTRFIPIPKNGDLLTGRYNFTQDRNQIPVTGGALFSTLRPRVRTQNYAFFLNRQFSDHAFDTIRLSFGRTRLFLLGSNHAAILPSSSLPQVPFLLNAPLLLNVTLPNADGTLNSPSFISASSAQGAAILNSLGYSAITQTEQITGPLGEVLIPGLSPVGIDALHFPQTRANNTIQVADTVRYIHSQHAFTFGTDIRKAQINSTLDRNFRPIAQFGSLLNSSAPLPLSTFNGAQLAQQVLSGTTLAAAGVPTGFFHTIGKVPDSSIGIRFTQVAFFLQDDWSPKPNVRWTMGVRYETNTIPDTEGHRLEDAFDPMLIKQLAEEAAATCQPRCNDLVPGLTTVFPADFRKSFGGDRNDFDVRLGFAYDVGRLLPSTRLSSNKAGKLVTRGGFGLYSGQYPGIVLSQSRNAFPNFLALNLANFSARLGNRSFLFNPANPSLQPPNGPLNVVVPGTLNTFQGTNTISQLASGLINLQALSLAPTALGLDLVLPQRRLKTAYALQYGVISEAEIHDDYYLSVSYVGTRGAKLLRLSTPDLGINDSQVNFTQVGTLGPSSFPFFTGTESAAQPHLVSSSFAVARTFFTSTASSSYNSLQVELRRRLVRNLQLGSALTYSHSLDDASDFFDTAGSFALPQDSRNPSEKASSSFDSKWRWTSHFLIDVKNDLPFLSKTAKSLGGWRLSGILTLQTGQPYTVNSAFDVNRDGNLTDRLNRTDGLISGEATGDKSVLLKLAPGVQPATLLAPDGSDGIVGRNTFRAPGISVLNLSITKNLNFSDKHRFYLRTEIFNVFNRTHFAIPDRILESPGFGKAVRTLIPARTVQFAFKYSF